MLFGLLERLKATLPTSLSHHFLTRAHLVVVKLVDRSLNFFCCPVLYLPRGPYYRPFALHGRSGVFNLLVVSPLEGGGDDLTPFPRLFSNTTVLSYGHSEGKLPSSGRCFGAHLKDLARIIINISKYVNNICKSRHVNDHFMQMTSTTSTSDS